MKTFLLRTVAILCALCLILASTGCGIRPNATQGTTVSTEAATDPSETTTQPTEEVTTAPAEETETSATEETEATEATTEPVAAPTQPATTPTESATTPTEPVITPTEPVAAPAEPTTPPAPSIDNTLTDAKSAAKSTLDTYAKLDEYRTEQKLSVASAINAGKSAIDAAANTAAVDAALAAAKAAIDEIPTNAELTAAEEQAAAEALASAKTAAKTALDSYVNADNYREAQKTELAAAITNGKTAINAASNIAAVDSALAAAKAIIDSIETDAEITAKSPVICGVLTDGMVVTNTRATLDVYAKTSAGVKLSCSKVTVTVNGASVTVNWDDTVKTSYNFVFEEGENTVVVTAVDGNYVTTETFTVICDMEAPTTITVSIEAFSVGLGYLVEPYKLVLDDSTLADMASLYGYDDAAEMKEKLSMAHCLDYALYTHGMSMSYQGSLESTWNGFYMSSVSGVDTSYLEVPAVLQEALEMNGFYPDPFVSEEGTLCEFDVTWGSGWMYVVNNSFPNIPFCDYVPQDGDVMRVQFTLAYGADIGDWGMMGEPYFETVDRDELTALIADAIEAGVDYSNAFEVVSTFGVTQEELNAAVEELKEQLS